MPSVSPFSMANEMPFTARTTPLRVWKKVRRLVTLSNGMIGEAERASQPRSAELYSAVSQSCTLPGVVRRQRLAHVRRPAECNSAIRQIENLRYGPNVLDLSCGRCPQGCLTVNHSRFCIVRVESWLILRRP